MKNLNKRKTIKNIMEKIILDNSTGVDIVKLNEKFKSDKNEEFIKNTALYYNAKVCYGK